MNVSVFDLFSIGLGPSSSHTVGPMRAAFDFLTQHSDSELQNIQSISICLYGSLAFTGVGHGTDKAIIMGLLGERPETADPEHIYPLVTQSIETKTLNLLNKHAIPFDITNDLQYNYDKTLPHHTNGMTLTTFDKTKNTIHHETYYSIGGGFIVSQTQLNTPETLDTHPLPYEFNSCKELLELCEQQQCSIAELMMKNELSWRDEKTIRNELCNIATIMSDSIKRGCHTTHTILPGGLNVRRRAPTLYQHLLEKQNSDKLELEYLMQWLDVYGIAVNEENAAGNRIVTAPTNGASGIIPAVLEYYKKVHDGDHPDKIVNFLLTAGAICILYKKNASISGAEMGCQGEVGVACSMAAGALAAVLGGTIYQVENAAEIGMEHNLGLTCDPVKGLVQIPCIERNAMGAVKAVNAAQLALAGDGTQKVSLDMVIHTMREIGENMHTIYKETSLGGLAVNVPEC